MIFHSKFLQNFYNAMKDRFSSDSAKEWDWRRIPYAYLKDILTRMTNGYPSNQIDDLLPWNWKPQYTVNT